MNHAINCTASELSIFLQGLAVVSSPTTSSDIDPSVPLKSIPFASKVSQHDSQPAHCPGSPSMAMSKNSTASHGTGLLMPSAADFLVQISAQSAKVQALTVKTQAFGENSPGYLAKYDPSSHSLKTAQGSLFSDSTASLQTLPRSGSMFNGIVSQPPKSVPTMAETVCGLLPSSRRPSYPTPLASDAIGGGSIKLAMLYLSGSRTNRDFVQGKLRDFVKLPSLQAAKPTKPPKAAIASNDLFNDEVFSSPCETNPHDDLRQTDELTDGTALPGQLSPDWDEWLMGFPVGWTDLSATNVRSLDWSEDPANRPKNDVDYLPRVVEGRLPNRKARIKAIGNAQVPLCAAVAFRLLTQRF